MEALKINKPSLAPVYNRLKVVFDMKRQFNLIEPIRLAIEKRVNSCVVSMDTNLREDVIGKVIFEIKKNKKNVGLTKYTCRKPALL